MWQHCESEKPLILHISDIHARGGQRLTTLAKSIARAITPHGEPSHIVASGDFGFQGHSIGSGVQFIRELAEYVHVSPNNIVCCPGNHDLQSDPQGTVSLRDYHREISRLLQNSDRSNPLAAMTFRQGDIQFLVLNSAYLLDWRAGQVDMGSVNKLREDLAETKIAVVHHHCIPYDETDLSHIANSYPLLVYLEQNGYHALLHGHRHMAMTIRLNTMRVFGVGSVNFEPEKNMNNQFNLLYPGKRVLRFRFIGDSYGSTGMGEWRPEDLSW
jgi:predicted MPP superfamily phosphohydrolase